MSGTGWFYLLSGLCAAVATALLISAARLCYRLEARSGRPMLKGGLPGYANVIPSAFNFGVARDAETQALRWQMNYRLIGVLVLIAAIYPLQQLFLAST